MSDTARLLAETTKRLVETARGSAGAPFNAKTLRDALDECDLVSALVPEEAGGSGCSLAEAAEICRAWGAAAAPLPIVELLLGPRLAAETDVPESVTLAHTVSLRAERVPGRVVLSGQALEAPAIVGSDTLLAAAMDSDGAGIIVALPAIGERFTTIDCEAWLRIRPDAVGVGAVRVLSAGPGAAETLARDGALLTAAAMCGALEQVVATMVEHANTRVQFGRPLGKFQAVQNLIADASAESAVTRAVLDAALLEAELPERSRLAWLAAKAQAGRAATIVAANAHQVLGAIGFTEEHELHRYTKRLWCWRDDWGRQADCEREIGGMAARAGRAGLWPMIADAV